MRFGKEQPQTTRAIDPGMAQDDEKIPFGYNPRLFRGELIATPGTEKISCLLVAEGVRGMATARHIKIPESGPSPLREDMTLPSPCEEILSCEIREIGAGCAGRIAKLQDQILRLDASFGVYQQQG